MEGSKLEARMLSGEPFTWTELGGTTQVDRMIQKLRKRGLIAFQREGRNCVWRATGAHVDPKDARIAELERALSRIASRDIPSPAADWAEVDFAAAECGRLGIKYETKWDE